LLNCPVEFIARGSKVFSVTSDIQASTALKTAAPKPSRSEASQRSDSFSALVNAATPPDGSGSTPASAPAPRANNLGPSQTREPSRTSGPAQAARSSTQSQDKVDDNSSASPNDRTDKTNSDSSTGATAANGSDSGADTTKAADDKTTDKTDGDQGSTDEAAAAAMLAGSATALPAPVAVPIQPEIVLADAATAATAAQASDTASTTVAPTAPGATAAPGITGSVDATAGLMAATTKSTGAAKTPGEPALAAAGPEAATTASDDTAVAADPGFAAALDAAVPGNAKVIGKPGGQPKTGLVNNGEAAKTTEQSNATAQGAPQQNHGNVGQQPAVAAKPSPGEVGEPAKDSSNAPAPAAHERGTAPANSQANVPASDPAAQATAGLQPQLTTQSSPSPQITSANLTATAATAAAVPLHGLAVEIAASALNGKSRFEVRLDPAELGRIDVRIDIDRNGQVTSHLRVEKPETLAMLQQTAPQLQQALQDAGLKSNNSGLQFSLRDHNSSGQNGGDNQQNANAQRLIVTEDETVPAQLAGRSYGRMFSAQGGVDIRV